jgi:hypothetical protein
MGDLAFPTAYIPQTNDGNSKDATIFVGLAVRGRLDKKLLEDKAKELIQRWPVLGGSIETKVHFIYHTESILSLVRDTNQHCRRRHTRFLRA